MKYMRLKIGNFTIREELVVYTEKADSPVTITLHLVNGETLEFTGDEATVLISHFEDQALNINI